MPPAALGSANRQRTESGFAGSASEADKTENKLKRRMKIKKDSPHRGLRTVLVYLILVMNFQHWTYLLSLSMAVPFAIGGVL